MHSFSREYFHPYRESNISPGKELLILDFSYSYTSWRTQKNGSPGTLHIKPGGRHLQQSFPSRSRSRSKINKRRGTSLPATNTVSEAASSSCSAPSRYCLAIERHTRTPSLPPLMLLISEHSGQFPVKSHQRRLQPRRKPSHGHCFKADLTTYLLG